jgi:hypothetical protein
LRRGDLTLRKLHYQTAFTQRQPLAASWFIATIHRDGVAGSCGINRRSAQRLAMAAQWYRGFWAG